MKFGKMNQLLLAVSFVTVSFTAQAADCPGQWRVLPDHYANRGQPCKVLGLDTHRGVCRPGNTYETLCDDTTKNRYRTCRGPRTCNSYGQEPPPAPRHNCTTWDFDAGRPCPPGFINSDCRNGCQPVARNNKDCTSWDYEHKRPCPPGYINRDCHGNCGPR